AEDGIRDFHVTGVQTCALPILRRDVDAAGGEDVVDLRQHAGNILVNVQQAVLARVCGQRHFREVDRGEGGTVVAVLDQLLRHFQSNVLLSFHRAAANVRCEDAVVELAQRRQEFFVVGAWFDREHINGSAGQVTTAQGVCERVDVDDGATGGVDENGSLFHPAYLFGADHVVGLRSLGHVQDRKSVV